MNRYVLLHFEHIYDVTIIVTVLHKATSLKINLSQDKIVDLYLVFQLLSDIISMLATYPYQLATRHDLSEYDIKIMLSIIF